MLAFKFIAVAVVAAILTGCAGSPDPMGPGPKENTGTLLGALGGAAVGSQFGGGTGGHIAGALIGAGIGGLIGNRIGDALDDDDKQRGYAAQMEGLGRGQTGGPGYRRDWGSGCCGTVGYGSTYLQDCQ